MKKAILCLVTLIVAINVKAQQDPNFSQYIFNTIHVNPAYAGYKENIYVQSHYRLQWAGVEGAPKSLSIAADGTFKNNKVGLSLLVNNDKVGAQNNLSAYAGYAYHLFTNYNETSKLSFGLSAGFLQSSLNTNILIANEEGDSYITAAGHSRLFPDARFGMIFTKKNFFSGVSASNLLMGIGSKIHKNEWYINYKPHFYFFSGIVMDITDDVKFKPMFLLKDDIGGPTNLDINSFILLKEKIWIGAMYRTAVPLYKKEHLDRELSKSSATGLMLEVFTNKMRIGYSFDYSLNRLKNYNNGTHEISIGIYLRESNNRNNHATCYF